mgnify:CR=1
MKFQTVKEAAERWGYSESTICRWCRKGIVQADDSAEKWHGQWRIPEDAECPKKAKK